MTGHVAPADRVLTVLHRRGDTPALGAKLATVEPVDGWTICGRPMLQSELWQPIEARETDSLCAGCESPEAAPAAHTQEALL